MLYRPKQMTQRYLNILFQLIFIFIYSTFKVIFQFQQNKRYLNKLLRKKEIFEFKLKKKKILILIKKCYTDQADDPKISEYHDKFMFMTHMPCLALTILPFLLLFSFFFFFSFFALKKIHQN